jgi:hypothetical protein
VFLDPFDNIPLAVREALAPARCPESMLPLHKTPLGKQLLKPLARLAQKATARKTVSISAFIRKA